MCFIGEWYGDTGTLDFAATLQSDFSLIRRVRLPNWTDTAHELTVWKRRSGVRQGCSLDFPVLS